MAKYHLIGVILNSTQRNEPAALRQVPSAGDGERLRIEIKGRLGVLLEETSGAPVVQVLRGPGINVEGGIISLALFATDDADEVVGAQLVIPGLHLRGYLVIGLCDDIFQPELVRVVTEGLEGSYLCHCE